MVQHNMWDSLHGLIQKYFIDYVGGEAVSSKSEYG